MGIFRREIPTEIIAAGVLAAMTLIIGTIQDANPIIVAVIAFVVIFIAFRVIYYLQKRNLKKQLGIEDEQWNRVREEKQKYRTRFEDCKLISNELLAIHETVQLIMVKQLLDGIDTETWKKFTRQFEQLIIRRPSWILFAIIYRIPLLKKLLNPQRFAIILLVDITGIFNRLQLGGLQLDKNPNFIELTNKVRKYQIGLPPETVKKIEAYINLNKISSCLLLFDISQDKFGNLPINPSIVNSLQFAKSSIDIDMSKQRAHIASDIECFMTGG